MHNINSDDKLSKVVIDFVIITSLSSFVISEMIRKQWEEAQLEAHIPFQNDASKSYQRLNTMTFTIIYRCVINGRDIYTGIFLTIEEN